MKKRVLSITLAIALLVGLCSVFSVMTGASQVAPELEITCCNLSLRDSICIKYAVKSNVSDVKLLVWTAPEAEYTVGTHDDEITESYVDEIDGVSYMIFDYTKLAAKQMTDVIYTRAYTEVDGVNYYSDINKYSILQYAYNKLGKTATASDDTALKALLTNMLAYGAAAQSYLDYKADRLATAAWVQVKLSAGVLDDGCTNGLYLPGDKVTMTASATDANGASFAYWADSKNNKVATTATYELTVGTVNEVYTPVYESVEDSFTVTFLDYDGTTVLKTETVESGESATAPADPVRDGYLFAGWDKAFDTVTGDLTVTATYTKITGPTIVIGNATGACGDEVEVSFDLVNSPNLYAMSLQISFDDTVLELVSATSGEAMGDFTYMSPSRLKNGANFIWYANDPASANGAVLKLTFKISDTAAVGSYALTMTCDPGNTYDENDNDVNLNFVDGCIVVTD